MIKEHVFKKIFFITLYFLVLCITLMPINAFADVIGSDNMENPDSGNWIMDTPWEYSTEDSYSYNMSVTDSPGAFYSNNLNASFTLALPIDLSNTANPHLEFWHKYDIEQNFDYGYLEISINAGASWLHLKSYTGVSPWTKESVDITNYAGYSDVRIRFRLVSDPTVRKDGWYIDDTSIIDKGASIKIGQFATLDSYDNWTMSYATGATVKIKEGIFIRDTLNQIYDFVIKVFFVDSKGKSSLLNTRPYYQRSPGEHYISEQVTLPDEIPSGIGKIRTNVVIKQYGVPISEDSYDGLIKINR